MATWQVGDATVESGGKVTGDGEDADTIRDALTSGSATFYPKAPPDCYRVDPASDWVLDRYLGEYANYRRIEVETDYKAKDEDMPPDVAEFLAELEAEPIPDGVVIF